MAGFNTYRVLREFSIRIIKQVEQQSVFVDCIINSVLYYDTDYLTHGKQGCQCSSIQGHFNSKEVNKCRENDEIVDILFCFKQFLSG